MPQDPFVIATKTESSEVHIFDYKNHPARPPIGGTSTPDLRLTGHHGHEGYGLSWSTINRGFLLSGSSDAKICLWDIDQAPLNKSRMDALLTFEAHQGIIEDVAWHLNHCYLFGSCGVDRYLRIYDLRSPCFTSPAQSIIAHHSAVNCLSFNPLNEWLVATGSDDHTVKFFDLRKLVRPLHTFDNHNDMLVKVEWSPHRENILASCCCDGRVMIWDTHGIGREESEGGTAELLHIHAGHSDAVADISWNPTEDGMIASVSLDSTLQVWKMADYVYSDY
ncbi:histone-binding protein MSI1-like [Bidens hawaiensis]|uniref:histone-binding protein MSI1-like n=1 Tax=Bidens hawaiensis TaxID=980011 RepID=UPI0040491C7E